jgi:hypothetical protein
MIYLHQIIEQWLKEQKLDKTFKVNSMYHEYGDNPVYDILCRCNSFIGTIADNQKCVILYLPSSRYPGERPHSGSWIMFEASNPIFFAQLNDHLINTLGNYHPNDERLQHRSTLSGTPQYSLAI